MAFRPHLSAAMLGFSLGDHMQPGLCHNVRFTRLASSLQTPNPAQRSGSTATQGDFTYTKPASAPAAALDTAVGYLDSSPEMGMSGGAVVDMHCGLLGISQGQEPAGRGGRAGAPHPAP